MANEQQQEVKITTRIYSNKQKQTHTRINTMLNVKLTHLNNFQLRTKKRKTIFSDHFVSQEIETTTYYCCGRPRSCPPRTKAAHDVTAK